MELKVLNCDFSVCKLKDITSVDLRQEFTFLSSTDEEISLVCPTEFVPKDALEVENDFVGFRIQGILDFSLIGILSKISTTLADNNIGIFVLSTFNTDYVLVKKQNKEKALFALKQNGYSVIE